MFDMTKAQRHQHVAEMLGFAPDRPDTWPTQAIVEILHQAEHAAARSVAHDVERIGGRYLRNSEKR